MKFSGPSAAFLSLTGVTLSMAMLPVVPLPPKPPSMPSSEPSSEGSSEPPVTPGPTAALVPRKDCDCKLYGIFDVKVAVHETPAGCGVVINTLAQTPTILELIPGHTLAVTRVPTAIVTTVTPKAAVRATTTVSLATFSACPSQHTTTETGADPSHETVIVCKSDLQMPEPTPCTTTTPIPTTTVTQAACA